MAATAAPASAVPPSQAQQATVVEAAAAATWQPQPAPRAPAVAVAEQQQAVKAAAAATGPAPAPPPRRAHRGLASLTLAGFDLDAVSVGGQETCVVVPALRLAFDAGRCPQRLVLASTLLLSHTHLDHVGGVGAFAATRSLLCLPPPTVVLPAACAPALERHLATLRELDGSAVPCALAPASPGDALKILDGRYVVHPFRTFHPVPSCGYCVSSRRAKLRPEHAGRPGAEIAALRRAGVAVTDELEVCEVAFTGDTSAEWLGDPGAARALGAKLLILECTFVCDAVSPAQARAFGHTHLDELVERAHLFRNEAVLLIHFSARYSRADIVAALAAKLPPGLAGRVTPLLEGFH